MVVARGIYDGRGTLILDEGTVLDARHLPILPRLEVNEILVQDSRVDDVIIVPLVSEETEAKAVRLLHRIMDGNRGKTIEYIKVDLLAVDRLVKDMVQGLYSVFMGEIDLEGCASLSNYDYVHPVKAAALSLLLGKQVGYGKSDLISLGTAALLQNVGYVLVSQNLLTGPERMSREKSEHFRKHPEWGQRIVHQSGDVNVKTTEAIWHHHEWWDGSGYPRGLKGKDISRYARIMAIASTYHSLVSRSSDRQPYFPPEAAEYIAAYSGELFDPELVQVFFRSVPFYTTGKMVKLNDGQVGIVASSNVGYVGRPVVRICYDRANQEVLKPYDIDLSKPEYQNVTIVEILDI